MPASYERRILPALHSICGRDPPAHELTGELFELLLQKLTDERNYSDGTAGHYRHLIPLAYQAGVEHDHFPDALMWEELFDAETATDEEDVELDLSAQRDSDLQTAMPMQRRVNSCAL